MRAKLPDSAAVLAVRDQSSPDSVVGQDDYAHGMVTARGAARRVVRWLDGRYDDPTADRNRRDDEHLALLLAFTLTQTSNCIDVGAHTGTVLREIVRLAPNGRHFAFEPLPALHAKLEREFPGVDVRPVALADSSGESSFIHVRNAPAYSGLRERDYPTEEAEREEISVAVQRLDDVLPEDYVPTLIKIDVEGGELQVFRGALETLRRHRPLVWFEHGSGSAEHYDTRSEDIHAVLVEDVGLRIFDADGRGPIDRGEFIELFYAPMWNFLAKV